jgi:hypothetical protein
MELTIANTFIVLKTSWMTFNLWLVGGVGVGKAKTWRFFGVLLPHIYSIMFQVVFTMCSQFVLGVLFTFFLYALSNVHLFCSHSSHVLSNFLCAIFLMLFSKFPWLLIVFPISNNLCQKSYNSLDNWAKMERLVCRVYFRCVQTLEISFLWGCKNGNMFSVVRQSTRPITRRRSILGLLNIDYCFPCPISLA